MPIVGSDDVRRHAKRRRSGPVVQSARVRPHPFAVVLTLVAVIAIALDLAFAVSWSGVLASLGMVALGAALLVRAVMSDLDATNRKLGAKNVARLEQMLLLACIGFGLARAFLVYEGLAADAGDGVDDTAARTYDALFLAMMAFEALLSAAPEAVARGAVVFAQRPALLLAGSFAAMIGIGSILLTLPVSVRNVANVSFIDSLFTITSAVCVTGLTVNDVWDNYTLFGQGVILAGIQLGGIGIMTLAALALTMGDAVSLKRQLRYAAMLDTRTLEDLRTLVRSIIFGTLVIEAIGAVLLWLLLSGDPRLEDRPVPWCAVFHAISAFCNAGFALFPGNLTPFRDDAGIQLVIMSLIVLGGLGFPVILELVGHAAARMRRMLKNAAPTPPRLSLATRLVLRTTMVLLLFGTAAMLLFEVTNSLAGLGTGRTVLAALFASVNTRTSGFNTVDIGAMRDATLLIMCVLMFIGGSPTSTAGGIKTTTAAVIAAALRAELRARDPELLGRALPAELLRKATAVAALSLVIVLVVVLALTLTEDLPFIKLAFEAVSAFGTVGLSTGITGGLTAAGKLIVALTMFIGRVGPLTIALAVGREHERKPYRLAPEALPVG